MQQYNHQQIERRWQRVWEQKKVWKVNLKKAKKPYYNLMMFPYPSAEGLHVGNVYAFTGSDIQGRFRRMQGYDVFEPMGFDSFGIHSENFAIKQGTHPKTQTAKNIAHFRKQLKQMGALFDWEHEVTTSEPEYYKWTQWLFLQLYKMGLAYRAKAPVDWCTSCKTVLADEQVINGRCERCDTQVVQKELEQWFFRITKYAERLLKNLANIDWSERTKIAQRNWIGRSAGAELKFKIQNSKAIEVFTTRPDTLFGATYMVLAPEHHLIDELKGQITNWAEVELYRKEAAKKNELERTELIREKTGIELKGIKAINPASDEEIPVWIADYVLASYGTGAIMAVPAHDERDFEFAKKYGLPIKKVIQPPSVNLPPPPGSSAYGMQDMDVEADCWTGDGKIINSGKFNGMDSEEAKWEITKFVGGKRTTKYHLRDWLISRQRYWGAPIPIIYCRRCWEIRNSRSEIRNKKEGVDYTVIEGQEYAIVPVPEKDLPVLLPSVKDFRPTGTDKSPLAGVESFVKTKCPQCKNEARRETDVSDTFLDSAWYYFRYPSIGMQNSKIKAQNENVKSKIVGLPWNTSVTKRWLPVDMYIGGQEHAVLHLLYTRFITMALHDMGYLDFEEPFKKFRAHGLITKGGAKMSKSKGNVVNPDEYFAKYGADTVRMYLMFLGPFSEGGDWSDKGIVGIYRFLNRVWNLVQKMQNSKIKTQNDNAKSKKNELEILRQRTIKKVTEDLEELRYNTAIAALMECSNALQQSNSPTIQQISTLLILLAPCAPYVTEELWQQLGNRGSVHNQPWPTYNPKKIRQERIRLILQVNGKVRDVVEVAQEVSEKKAKQLALESTKIQKWLRGEAPKKIIYVPRRLVNVVV